MMEKYDASSNRIRYLISLKSGITCIFCHYFVKIKVDFYDVLPIEKILSLHSIFLNQFLIKIKITTTIRYLQKNAHIN